MEDCKRKRKMNHRWKGEGKGERDEGRKERRIKRKNGRLQEEENREL